MEEILKTLRRKVAQDAIPIELKNIPKACLELR